MSADGQELRGKAGIGPLGSSDPSQWRKIGEMSFGSLLENIQKSEPSPGTITTDFATTLRLPASLFPALQDATSVPAAHRRRAQDLMGTDLGRLYEGDGNCEFAWVPLKTANEPVGVLIVDCRSIHSATHLDLTCEPVLVAFADLAAMGIVGDRLRARVATDSQLAKWREGNEQVAHVIMRGIEDLDRNVREADRLLRAHEITRAKDQFEKVDEAIVAVKSLFDRIKLMVTCETTEPVKGDVNLHDVLDNVIQAERGRAACTLEFKPAEKDIRIRGDPRSFPSCSQN